MKEVYLDLLKKGVHFPASDAEAETAEREVVCLFFDSCKVSVLQGSFLIERESPSSIQHKQKDEFIRRILQSFLERLSHRTLVLAGSFEQPGTKHSNALLLVYLYTIVGFIPLCLCGPASST